VRVVTLHRWGAAYAQNETLAPLPRTLYGVDLWPLDPGGYLACVGGWGALHGLTPAKRLETRLWSAVWAAVHHRRLTAQGHEAHHRSTRTAATFLSRHHTTEERRWDS
jgi:hypothetical protein